MLKFKKLQKAAPEGNNNKGAVGNPQGISATGNALRKIGGMALLAILLPVLLGFGYLLLLREPTLQEEQIDRLVSSLASQQADDIHRMLVQLKARLQSAALSPLTLSAIASNSADEIALVEKTLLDYFPEVISLRIIPIGDMGTAEFAEDNRGLRNHIEVDLVRRASERETEPEAYKFEDKWLTSMASRITHPRMPDRRGVIIITLDNEQFSKQLNSLDPASGNFALEQPNPKFSGKGSASVIAASGDGSAGINTRFADVADTSWRVSFSPSDALMSKLSISRLPVFTVLALVVFAAIGSLSIILILFPKTLGAEVDKVVAAADQKSPLDLAIPELVSVAKQLRRATLRAVRQSNAGVSASSRPRAEAIDSGGQHLTFLSKKVVDDEETLDLDLDSDTADQFAANDEYIPAHIFRAYDIRGHAQSELTDELVTKIAQAIGTIAGEMGEQTLIVGCDGRTSSPRIKSALIRAILETGRDVIDIGLVPTPLLYFATRHLEARSGVMVTGSHNPADENGLKIVLNRQTIAAGGIKQVLERVVAGNFSSGNGRMTREDIVPAYMDEVLHDIAIAVPLKIVIDAGNGATGDIAPKLFEDLGCEVQRLNCHIDGRFPGHPPDTSNERNLADLVKVVMEVRADFGVAFDGDGDRLAVVTSSGQIVRSDVLLMIFAQDVVSRNPGADVVFDVKCSRHLSKLVTRHGGRPVLWKTGHAFMKEKMKETGALLGGEFSGHMFFGERWYGFDDGMYAAGRLAEILSTHGESLDDCIAKFPVTVNTPEIIIPVADTYKFELVEKIISNADFSSGKVSTMDGIRVDFSNGWGLVRASNTGPALTARFEADTQENLEIIQDEFRAQIALVDPEIDLNF